MRNPERTIGRLWWAVLAGVIAFTISLLVFGIIDAGAKPGPSHKVTICHAKPADTAKNGWNLITVDVASVGYQKSGHQDQHDADIIPPWSYTYEGETFSYPGKGDQSILENGCEALPEVKWAPAASLIGPCGDPFYGYVLDNSASDVDATFTITYYGVVGPHNYAWVNRVVDVPAGTTVQAEPTNTGYLHVKAGTSLTIVASSGQLPIVPVVSITTEKSGRVDCPWGARA